MDEHVEGGDHGGELLAGLEAEDGDLGQPRRELLAQRPAADHHHPAAGQAGEGGEPVDALLGGEAADVADQGLAAGREAAAQRLAAVARVETSGVDAPPPDRDRADAVLGQDPGCASTIAW